MKNLVNYIYELFQLKQLKHKGWYMANQSSPDTLAEHALLASQIGYILADMEGADKLKVLEMLVFHDNAEVRIGDFTKVNVRYIKNKIEIEKQALSDQVQALSDHLQQRMLDNYTEMEEKTTLEARIVKDADYLEQAFQGRIYLSIGITGAQNWIDNIGKALRTESAKKMFATLIETSPNEWFVDLKDLSNG